MTTLAQAPSALLLNREALARDIRALPSLPPVVMELLSLMQKSDTALDHFADTLRLDQALSVIVLQLANSPFYGLSGRISSVRDAINVLGLRQLGTLVVAAALNAQLGTLGARSREMQVFWRHSIACGVAARHLARLQGWNEAVAFTAGLLHDIGRLVVDSHYPDRAAQVMAWAKTHDMSHSEAERQLTGVDHTELGQWVCEHWRFPTEITQAIAQHHCPPENGPATLSDVVHVADAMAHTLDLTGQDHEAEPPARPWSWQRLKLSEEILLTLLQSAEEEFHQLEAVLQPAKETP